MSRRRGPKTQMPKRHHLGIKKVQQRRDRTARFIARKKREGNWIGE